MFAAVVPTFAMVKLSVAPLVPVACSIPAGNVPITTRGPVPVTVTVVVAEAEPPGPVAVRVYVVVCLGVTLMLPPAGTVPTPLSIEAEPALMVDQLRVDDSPALMVEGLAVKVVTAGPGVP